MSYHITDNKLTKKDMQEYCRTDPQDLATAIREAEDLVPLAKSLQLMIKSIYYKNAIECCICAAIDDIIKAHADKWPSEDEL